MYHQNSLKGIQKEKNLSKNPQHGGVYFHGWELASYFLWREVSHT